tara:strand:+ start:22533 stop:24668 length:2136 start_codon:yes stop_codon:yes gene_type:complete
MSLTISSSIQLVQYFDTTASFTIASLPTNILANIKQIYRLSSTGGYEAWTKDGGKAFDNIEYGEGYLFVSEDNATFPYTVSPANEDLPTDINISGSVAIVRQVGGSVDLSVAGNITNYKQIYKRDGGAWSVWNKVGGKAFTTLDDGESYLITSEDNSTFPYLFVNIVPPIELYSVSGKELLKLDSVTGATKSAIYLGSENVFALAVNSVDGFSYLGVDDNFVVVDNTTDRVIRDINLGQYGVGRITSIIFDDNSIYLSSSNSNLLLVVDRNTYSVEPIRVGTNGISEMIKVDEQIYTSPVSSDNPSLSLLEDVARYRPTTEFSRLKRKTVRNVKAAFSENAKIVAMLTVSPEQQEANIRVYDISSGEPKQLGNVFTIELINGLSATSVGDSLLVNNDGDKVFIGSQLSNSSRGFRSGSIMIYHRKSTGSWFRKQIIYGQGVYDLFPENMSLSRDGNVLSASSAFHSQEENVNLQHGAVYIYRMTSAKLFKQEYFYTDNTANSNQFIGGRISLSGAGRTLAASDAYGNVLIFNYDDVTDPAAPTWVLSSPSFHVRSNTSLNGRGNYPLSLNYNGDTLAVGVKGTRENVDYIKTWEYDGASWVNDRADIKSKRLDKRLLQHDPRLQISEDGNKILTASSLDGIVRPELYSYISTTDYWSNTTNVKEQYRSTTRDRILDVSIYGNTSLDFFGCAFREILHTSTPNLIIEWNKIY